MADSITPDAPAPAAPAPAAPTVDLPPPDLSIPSSAEVVVPATPPGTETPSTIDDGYKELNSVFGINSDGIANNEAAATSLKPVIEMIAQAGMNAAQAPVPAPTPTSNAPTQPQGVDPNTAPPGSAAPPVLNFDDLDLGDASPEMVKVIKTIGERSQAAIKVATDQAVAAQQAVTLAQQTFDNQTAQHKHALNAQIGDRALEYLDSFASPKYGVGNNRTMVQNLESEKLMRAAGTLLRGWESYGQHPPIEKVIDAAFVLVEGSIPTPVQTIPVTPGLAPTAPKGAAPPVTRGRGSAGSGNPLMDDPDFMAGATAIVNR